MKETNVQRVLLAGHTGLEKRLVADRLGKYLEETKPAWKNRVACEDLDNALAEIGEPTSRQMIDVRSQSRLRNAWTRGWERLLRRLEDHSPCCAVVCMHFVLADKCHRVCPAFLNQIAAWGPDLVITLIDDIYAVKRRAQAKGYPFTFQQLYDWRTIELTFADQVGLLASEKRGMCVDSPENNRAFTDSIVLSVNSPIRTVARLITEPRTKRVYASFPITSTRGCADQKTAINRFRRQLYDRFVVFDPVGIDELPLLETSAGHEGICKFHPELMPDGAPKACGAARWDSRFSDATAENGLQPLLPPQASLRLQDGTDAPFYPVEFPEHELSALKYGDVSRSETTVHDQLTARDLRLVEQSDFVVAYRPWWDGDLSGGVRAEIVHAREGCRPPRDVYAYVANDTTEARALEQKIRFVYRDETEFWNAMDALTKAETPFPRFIYY